MLNVFYLGDRELRQKNCYSMVSFKSNIQNENFNPDVIIVDGGRGQFNIIEKILNK